MIELCWCKETNDMLGWEEYDLHCPESPCKDQPKIKVNNEWEKHLHRTPFKNFLNLYCGGASQVSGEFKGELLTLLKFFHGYTSDRKLYNQLSKMIKVLEGEEA